MLDKVLIKENSCYNMDCEIGMKLMQEQGLKADWCITDPPYGIGYDKQANSVGGTQNGNSLAPKREYSNKGWDNIRIGGA